MVCSDEGEKGNCKEKRCHNLSQLWSGYCYTCWARHLQEEDRDEALLLAVQLEDLDKNKQCAWIDVLKRPKPY